MSNSESIYYLYKVTNTINNKIYVGVHQTHNIDDGYMGSGVLLKKAQAKHGIENFQKEILEYFDNPEDMYKREREVVNEEFLARNDVYNLRIGGTGGWIERLPDGSVQHNNLHNHRRVGILRQIDNGTFVPYCYKKSEEELKEIYFKISDALKAHIDEYGSWWTGKHHKESTKCLIGEKSSVHQTGSGNSQYGTTWIYSIDSRETKRIKDGEEIPKGWKLGRIQNWEFADRCCSKCGKPLHLDHPCKVHICNECKEKECLTTSEFYNKIYQYYKTHTAVETIEHFGLNCSRPNLLQQFKRYVEEYKN